MSVSLCPTPTVSTKTVSHTCRSRKTAKNASRLKPPSRSRAAKLRAYTEAPGGICIRLRSPNSAPPEILLDGSTATTPRRRLAWIERAIRRAISELLPTPGGPVMPTTCAEAGRVANSSSKAKACSWRWGRRSSRRFRAAAIAFRSN